MFNPNFSLFVPVPEGGNTFQPNPNSIVQNDEARGTNHLDFFKFVGRVVGKALYDGMFVDAYFTRSLYKHMLDQPLTYMVRPPALAFFKTAHIRLALCKPGLQSLSLLPQAAVLHCCLDPVLGGLAFMKNLGIMPGQPACSCQNAQSMQDVACCKMVQTGYLASCMIVAR